MSENNYAESCRYTFPKANRCSKLAYFDPKIHRPMFHGSTAFSGTEFCLMTNLSPPLTPPLGTGTGTPYWWCFCFRRQKIDSKMHRKSNRTKKSASPLVSGLRRL